MTFDISLDQIYDILEHLNDNHMYTMMKGGDYQETKYADAK